eukprot:gnl/TRDRNA2_/TRDRNA2_160844_c1_seq3.p1 gnl/TRDRNA2_/TRDRNA2_160844_c1~~gnl/TRDRNA2_/TRDRNA2_160844_c1_seq3.p1  ORF type:complete len:547 (-),score=100.52 gnl/TRDRNA2_/TRDRNA2_160844_c1_seq3:233-1873(-)
MMMNAPVAHPMSARGYGLPNMQGCPAPRQLGAPATAMQQHPQKARHNAHYGQQQQIPRQGQHIQQTPVAQSFQQIQQTPVSQSFQHIQQTPVAQNDHLGPDVSIWLKEAENFELNSDFDITNALPTQKLNLANLMAIMKTESAGKRTIKALADKLTLHRLLDNLGVPQLPLLLQIDGTTSKAQIQRGVERCIDKHLCRHNAPALVVKPSHLSNGMGVLTATAVDEHSRDDTIKYLVRHIEQFMTKKAGDHESLALQSLKPGFMIQPRYNSVVQFKNPLELRVVAIWGKVREAIWWWGRQSSAPGETPQRNAWLVRRPKKGNSLSDNDGWELLHEHSGSNPGWESALKLLKRHMPAMAKTTEVLATAMGTPFVRADFFVGDVDHGVRLNEVAYGCGVDYRWRPLDSSQRMVDDAPAIAHILQKGMDLCQKVMPPEHFLSRLGAEGSSYEEMVVTPLSGLSRRWMQWNYPANALQGESDENAEDCTVADNLCSTHKRMDGPPTSHGGRSPPTTARGGYPASILSPRMVPVRGQLSSGPQVFNPYGGRY